MEIKVNDYIRTIDGYIRKVTQVNKKGTYEGICYGAYSVDKPYKNSQGISEKKIVKHSKNIIDLIQVGDIVEIEHKPTGGHSRHFIDNGWGLQMFLDNLEKFEEDNIIAILTHEQFNQMKYIVGGEQI